MAKQMTIAPCVCREMIRIEDYAIPHLPQLLCNEACVCVHCKHCKHCMHSLNNYCNCCCCFLRFYNNASFLSSPSVWHASVSCVLVVSNCLLYCVCVCVLYCFLFWPAVGKLDTFFATLFLFNVQIFGYRHFERRQLQHSVNCLLQIFSEKVNCRSVQTVCQWSFLFFFFILQASQVNCKVQPIGCIQMVR